MITDKGRTSARISKLFLILSLCLSTALPYPIFASETNESEKEASAASTTTETSEFTASIHALGEVVEGRAVGHPLDPFRLLDQNVVHEIKVPVLARDVRVHCASERVQLLWKGDVFHEFSFDVVAVERRGDYLVLLEKDSFLPKSGVQNVLFIDLKTYETSLGKTALPIFRIPLKTDKRIDSLADIPLERVVFHEFSDLFQVAFNVTANLVDPKTYADAGKLVSSFASLFQQQMEASVTSMGNQLTESLQLQKAAGPQTEGINSFYQKRIREVSANTGAQRKLMNRVAFLWARLSLPHPDGAPQILRALAMVAAGLSGSLNGGLREGVLELAHHPYLRRGVPVVAAAVLAVGYPAEFSHFLYQALSVSSTVIGGIFGKASDVAYVGAEAIKASIWGINPVAIAHTYLTPNRLPKLMVGLSSMMSILYLTIGLPHMVVNTARLVKDLRSGPYQEIFEQEGFRKAFIARQSDLRKEALQRHSEQEVRQNGGKLTFTPEEDQAVREYIAQHKEQSRTWFTDFFSSVKDWPVVRKLSVLSTGEIETFGGALMHFLFSYCSLTNTVRPFTKVANSFFALTSFLSYPTLWYNFVAYPNYFKTLIRDGEDVDIPTRLNGGKANRFEVLRRKFLSRTKLENIERWEEQILPVEHKVIEATLQASFDATLAYSRDRETIKHLFEKNGLKSVTDPSAKELSFEDQTFFRVYFDKLFDRSMEAVLKRHAERVAPGLLQEEVTTIDLKEGLLEEAPDLRVEISAEDAAAVVAAQVAETSLLDEAKAETKSRWTSAASWASHYDHHVLNRLDPQYNRQVQRIIAVNKQSKNPKAMARAVREMIGDLLVVKPLQLVMAFACSAGIQGGMLQPLQDEFIGDNSLFYLSRKVFFEGYMYGMVTSILFGTWTKLQMDEFNEGQFDKKLTPEAAKRSFLSNYFHVTFSNENVGFLKSYTQMARFTLAGLRSSLVTAVLVDLLILQRFDADSFLLAYLTIFAVPMSAVSQKFEQGFEIALAHLKKIFPPELVPHPEAQEYMGQVAMRLRLKKDFIIHGVENFVGNILQNFENMRTLLFGTRSLARVLFPGKMMLAERFGWADAAVQASDKVPHIVKHVSSECAKLLLNKNTDATNLPPGKGF